MTRFILYFLRLAYSTLFTLLLPLIFLRLWWKGARLPAYRQRWAERLGLVSFSLNKNNMSKPIWIHAVSVGEVLAAVPLIKALQLKYPNTPIVITTMTPTGSERVQVHFKSDLNKTLFHSYVPYDIPFIIHRFLKTIQPSCLIIMETEIWPNLLAAAHDKQIPVVIVNARLSPHSVKNYQRLGWIIKAILENITQVAAQSALDASRYARIGMPEQKINHTGNIKYDLNIPPNTQEKGRALRERWGVQRPVWIAASTHKGEESLLLSVFAQLQKKYPDLLLLLVPRHPDRFEAVYRLCIDQNLRVARKTQIQSCKAQTQVFLGDTMGDLWEYYAASTLVFVGGSLVPVGGHNFLEPAALGLPIITGPHIFNFVEISDNLIVHGGLKVVKTPQELEQQVADLLDNPGAAKQMGLCAQRVVEENRGALDRVLNLIGDLLVL